MSILDVFRPRKPEGHEVTVTVRNQTKQRVQITHEDTGPLYIEGGDSYVQTVKISSRDFIDIDIVKVAPPLRPGNLNKKAKTTPEVKSPSRSLI